MLTEETSLAAADYRRDLGDGLLLRWSTIEDTEKIAHLMGTTFRAKADAPFNERMANTIRLLMRGDSPVMGPGDYAIVEDTQQEGCPAVAGIGLWRQSWAYEGIPFEIGRPEIVGTHPSYRNRGLVRKLFELVHTRSEAEGHPVQAITGIPYFYRQFGYEFALDLGGRRTVPFALIPKLKEGETEPYTLHDATQEDIPFIQLCYNRRSAESMVWTPVSDHYWSYMIAVKQEKNVPDPPLDFYIAKDTSLKPVAYLMTIPKRWGRDMPVPGLEVAPGIPLPKVLPSVLRALHTYGLQMPIVRPTVTDEVSEISFMLGRTHPVYEALGREMAAFEEPPYAWYVRVPNLPAFIKLIAPVLEKRLHNSDAAGYSGEIKLDFYRGGLRLVWQEGRLETAEHWQAPLYDANPGAGFPPLVFLQILFGRCSLDQLRAVYPDVWTNAENEFLLKILFPTRLSITLPL